MVKQILPLLALLCFAGAQNSNFPLEHYLFAGTLGDHALRLDLFLESSSEAGEVTAQLVGLGRERSLGGSVETDGSVSLRTPDGAVEIEGDLPVSWSDAPASLVGVLTEGEEVTPFSLGKVAEYITQSWRQGAFLEVESVYPFFTASPWRELNQRLRAEVVAPTERFVREGQALAASEELNYPWTRHETLETKRHTPRVLSLLGTTSFYTGGAHPNVTFYALNFLWEDGAPTRLELRDLFTPGAADEALSRVADYVLADLRRQGAAWVVDGTVSALSEELEVFTLGERGLTFVFAPYAVGPYVQGAFFVTVPYEALRGSLEPVYVE